MTGLQPNLQLRFVSGLGTQPDGVASYEDIGRAGMPDSGMTFQSIAVRPVSRGRVELDTADPLAPPRLWPGFCEAAEDLTTLREGIRLARRLAASKAFDDVRGEEVWPNPNPSPSPCPSPNPNPNPNPNARRCGRAQRSARTQSSTSTFAPTYTRPTPSLDLAAWAAATTTRWW